MFTDADIETAQLAESAASAAAGVCVHCDDALDPTHPKWAADYARRSYTAEQAAASLGPACGDGLPYHVACLEAVTEGW